MPTTIIRALATQKIQGPHGLVLEMDATEMFPGDPGMGTPLLFTCGGESMTWNCGHDNLCDIMPNKTATERGMSWARGISNQVEAWETYWWAIKNAEATPAEKTPERFR